MVQLKVHDNGSTTCETAETGENRNKVSEEIDKQQHKCSICFKPFESVLLLDAHYVICKKTLQYKICKKYSDNVKEFEEHEKMCQQMFYCDVCGKRFDDSNNCAKHMETCTGKLKCIKCDITFGHWKLLVKYNVKLHEK